jgi:hypothetical protein
MSPFLPNTDVTGSGDGRVGVVLPNFGMTEILPYPFALAQRFRNRPLTMQWIIARNPFVDPGTRQKRT